MKIALCADAPHTVNNYLLNELKERGHSVVSFGAIESGQQESWVDAAIEAANAVSEACCDEGIFLCWTGTGVSIAANKLPGIRAALCCDPETAQGRAYMESCKCAVFVSTHIIRRSGS